MKRTSLILMAVCVIVMLPAAFGQGTPSQSQEPSTQTPSAQQPSQSPSTGKPSSSASDEALHSFVGSIVKNGDKYMLHTGGTDYQLDDQAQASKFEGKDVKVTGQVDRESDTIRVQSIEPASSM
jgi:uncharacterized protein YdeI (BOF family)